MPSPCVSISERSSGSCGLIAYRGSFSGRGGRADRGNCAEDGRGEAAAVRDLPQERGARAPSSPQHHKSTCQPFGCFARAGVLTWKRNAQVAVWGGGGSEVSFALAGPVGWVRLYCFDELHPSGAGAAGRPPVIALPLPLLSCSSRFAAATTATADSMACFDSVPCGVRRRSLRGGTTGTPSLGSASGSGRRAGRRPRRRLRRRECATAFLSLPFAALPPALFCLSSSAFHHLSPPFTAFHCLSSSFTAFRRGTAAPTAGRGSGLRSGRRRFGPSGPGQCWPGRQGGCRCG